MNKIEPQAWECETDWKWPEERGRGDIGGKKGKGLDQEHYEWPTHMDNSMETDCESVGGRDGGGQRGNN